MTEAMLEHDFMQRDGDELAADHLVRTTLSSVVFSDLEFQAMYGFSSEGPSDDQGRDDPNAIQLKVRLPMPTIYPEF